MAGAAHPAHHLVEDQEHAVAVANLADAPEIARNGGHRAQGRADHRLGDESHHRVGAEGQDLVLQLLRDARVGMAQAGDRRAARAVEVALSALSIRKQPSPATAVGKVA